MSAPSTSASTKRPGCSDWALLSRPHTAAWATSGESAPTATAPRVATSSREPVTRSSASQRCTSSSAAVAAARAEPSAGGTVATTTSGAPSASASSSSASSTTRAVAPVAGTGTQSTVNSERGALSSRAWSTGRTASAPIDTTGAPVSSTASSRSAESPAATERTRSRVAPGRPSRTPVQLNGIRCPSSPSVSRITPLCRAASNRAGWMPYPSLPAASGSSTSAYVRSPSRQAARTPWKAGPYA